MQINGFARTYKTLWKYRFIYLLTIPTLLYFLVFAYIPLYGITIAFKDFKIYRGLADSSWVGFKYFSDLFFSVKFPEVIRNTVIISLYRLLFGFPIPILFVLLLNEVRHMLFKRTVQTVTSFPHFLSWVVFGGIVFNVIGPSGMINLFLKSTGISPIEFLTSPDYFRAVVVATGILKEFGWGAIIYLAALSGIDPQLYEAVKIDGAGKLKQIWHVTLPGLRPTIVMMFILSLAGILDAGFEQILILSNPFVLGVSDILDTYVYRVGLLEGNFGLATATGLFKGVIGAILIIVANSIIRRSGEKSLW